MHDQLVSASVDHTSFLLVDIAIGNEAWNRITHGCEKKSIRSRPSQGRQLSISSMRLYTEPLIFGGNLSARLSCTSGAGVKDGMPIEIVP
jgi:hypothetical protein